MAWQRTFLSDDGHLVIWTSWRLVEKIDRRCGNKRPMEFTWGIFTDGLRFAVRSLSDRGGWSEPEECDSLEAARAGVNRQAEYFDKMLRDLDAFIPDGVAIAE